MEFDALAQSEKVASTSVIDMENLMLIEVANPSALGILHELEQLNLIKVVVENYKPAELSLGKKYKGIISKEQGEDLKAHARQMRDEWNDI